MPFHTLSEGPFAGVKTDVDTSNCGACALGHGGSHVHPPLKEEPAAAKEAQKSAATPQSR